MTRNSLRTRAHQVLSAVYRNDGGRELRAAEERLGESASAEVDALWGEAERMGEVALAKRLAGAFGYLTGEAA